MADALMLTTAMSGATANRAAFLRQIAAPPPSSPTIIWGDGRSIPYEPGKPLIVDGVPYQIKDRT